MTIAWIKASRSIVYCLDEGEYANWRIQSESMSIAKHQSGATVRCHTAPSTSDVNTDLLTQYEFCIRSTDINRPPARDALFRQQASCLCPYPSPSTPFRHPTPPLSIHSLPMSVTSSLVRKSRQSVHIAVRAVSQYIPQLEPSVSIYLS